MKGQDVSHPRFLVLLAPVVFLVAACGSESATVPGLGPPGDPLTSEEKTQFERAYFGALETGSTSELNALFDMAALARRTFQGLPVPDRELNEFTRGMGGAMTAPGGIVNVFIAQAREGATHRLLRHHRAEGEDRALVRINHADGAVNYVDYFLRRDAEKAVKIVDMFAYLSSENLSDSMRRLVIPLVAAKDKGLLGRLSRKDRAYQESLKDIVELNRQVQRGNGKKALEIADGLVPELREDKGIGLIRVQAAGLVDDETYANEIGAYRRRFPNDPSVDLISIDYFVLKKQTQAVIAAIDSVNTALGGDAYMLQLRAGQVAETGDFARARKDIQESLQAEPDSESAHWLSVSIELMAQDHPRTLEALKALDRKFPQEWDSFDTVSDYSEFVASPQHGEWLEYLKAK